MDDIYIDDTYARVFLGDSINFSGCNKKEMQIPTAWSGNLISISPHLGVFQGKPEAFLYVVDANGQANSQGLRVNLFIEDRLPPAFPVNFQFH
jgi:hypothetical protein